MKKIVIIGSGGSGKSTFSKKLGERLHINVYHLDALFWKANWEGTPKAEQINIQKQLVQQDEWIIDGNYGGTLDIRLNAADTIIFLDIPRLICIYRLIKRRIKYNKKTRPDMGVGNEEKLDIEFLKWVWQYPVSKRPHILEKLELLSMEKEIVQLKSSKEVETYLESL
ncbi:DNA topology modulation protein [Bacillus sp. EAC]|uniref:DNA topology modulation protein n=1 Tax=Bacillus sp. EAC TaxID=1978338 RepID=UPI000B4475AB|nr:DNA topology modulation protein [Bacillus sp. EAC]